MVIRAIRDIEARKAAQARAAAGKVVPPLAEQLNSNFGQAVMSDMDPPALGGDGLPAASRDAFADLMPRKRKRGHAVKDAHGKWQPTGAVGFAAPPEHCRFKPGNKGGGRKPKRQESGDDILKRLLEKKRSVRFDGQTQKLETKELLLIGTLKAALEGHGPARKHMLAEVARLYPSQSAEMLTNPDINESDALSFKEFRQELLAELERETKADEPTEDVSGDQR